MFSPEDNETLTRVGPGTPMGNLIRQYWVPALMSHELPVPDGPPVRVMLLGERLIAFRDSDGRVGLIGEACPHRGASLFLAHNRKCGLRCSYHGWKFDVHGNAVDVPLMRPAEPGFRKQVKATAYPCRERGGVVWAYLGPREIPPPLPDIPVNADDGRCEVYCTHAEGNWLQHLENGIDFSHLLHLHHGNIDTLRRTMRTTFCQLPRHIEWTEPADYDRLEMRDGSAGCTFAAGDKPAADGTRCWGIGQYMFPFYAMLPQRELGNHWVILSVPMDDEHTMTYGMLAHGRIVSPEFATGPGHHHLPNTTDWFGRFRLVRNSGNDFGIDRELQNDPDSSAYGSGLLGSAVQDLSIASSMGPIADRSREQLGPDDLVVVRVRQRLLEAARALAREGTTPPGVDRPELYRARHGSLVLPVDADWREHVSP